MSEAVDFVNLVIAAMLDAAIEGEMTQLKCTVDTDSMGEQVVRVIVVPEKMRVTFPQGVKPNDEAN